MFEEERIANERTLRQDRAWCTQKRARRSGRNGRTIGNEARGVARRCGRDFKLYSV